MTRRSPAEAPQPGPPVIHVMDPLITAADKKRLAVLLRRNQALADLHPVGLVFGATVLGVLLGFGVGLTAGWLPGLVTGVFAPPTLALGWVFGALAWLKRTANAHEALLGRWEITVPGHEAGDLVTRIVANIEALPVSMRADFAPLIATVREVCAALLDAPGDERLLGMLEEREMLVVRIYAEYNLAETRQKALDVEDRVAGVLNDGYDIEMLTVVRDALAAYRIESART